MGLARTEIQLREFCGFLATTRSRRELSQGRLWGIEGGRKSCPTMKPETGLQPRASDKEDNEHLALKMEREATEQGQQRNQRGSANQ